MTKICFTPPLTRLQGCQGCQKTRTTKLKSTWSTKIQPKLKRLWKNINVEQKLSKKSFFLKVFQILFNLGQILTLQLTKVVFSFIFQIFDTPGTPGGVSKYHWFKICLWFFLYRSAIWQRYHLHWFNIYKKWQYHFL